jgi:hypothetical protein
MCAEQRSVDDCIGDNSTFPNKNRGQTVECVRITGAYYSRKRVRHDDAKRLRNYFMPLRFVPLDRFNTSAGARKGHVTVRHEHKLCDCRWHLRDLLFLPNFQLPVNKLASPTCAPEAAITEKGPQEVEQGQ